VTFHDHFSARAAEYARARPDYPPELFNALAALAPAHRAAWDCGTGSGQAAVGLAEHFAQVTATDASAAQLAEARRHPRVTYRVAPERASGLDPNSVDLVTAAQAAHWFDRDAFYAEARRVLRPKGVIAIWCYALCHIAPGIDEQVLAFYRGTVGPFWPPERRHTEDGYRSFDFPFQELTFPAAQMGRRWNLIEFGAYLRTWSAVTRFTAERHSDPVGPFLEELEIAWGGAEAPRTVSWPLAGRIGRVP